MLTKQLRELEGAGLITRTVQPVVPPRVDYALTPDGQSLREVVAALKVWGEGRIERIRSGEDPSVRKAA